MHKIIDKRERREQIRGIQLEYPKMFLTKDQIVRMTGYKFRNMQIKWLAEHGYKFDVTAAGNPIVLEAHINERLSGLSSKTKPTLAPNFNNKKIFA